MAEVAMSARERLKLALLQLEWLEDVPKEVVAIMVDYAASELQGRRIGEFGPISSPGPRREWAKSRLDRVSAVAVDGAELFVGCKRPGVRIEIFALGPKTAAGAAGDEDPWLRTLPAPDSTNEIEALAVDGETVVVGAPWGVFVLRRHDGHVLHALRIGRCTGVCVHGGELFASSFDREEVQVYALADGRRLREFGGTPGGGGGGAWGTGQERGDGRVRWPYQIAVDGDEVLVVDNGLDCVHVFDRASGRFLRHWGDSGGGPGQFRSAVGLAVCGDEVAVSDDGRHDVQVFARADGRFLRSFYVGAVGVGLARAGPRLFVPSGVDRVVAFE